MQQSEFSTSSVSSPCEAAEIVVLDDESLAQVVGGVSLLGPGGNWSDLSSGPGNTW